MSSTAHKPLITEELLHRAWRDVRRPGWGSFNDAMADPVHGALVRARAAALAHAAQGPPRQSPPLKHTRQTHPLPPLHKPAHNDAKRAAAGDTDSAFDDEDTP